jgi:hypothetical protein
MTMPGEAIWERRLWRHKEGARPPAGSAIDPIEAAELDVDTRLANLWKELAGVDECSLELAGALMRAAYAKGYCDALVERNPGALIHSHPEVTAGPR